MAYSPERWRYSSGGVSEPAANAIAVVPHASTDQTVYAKALYVGGAGDVTVIMVGDYATPGTPVTFSGVPAGTILPIQVRRVNAIGTTATLIVALYD